jgi:thioesterase domain-containing protein
LAKVIGEDHPFLFVVLTAEDLVSLGRTPTLQSIAACLLRKILVMQPEGPYTIGGLCAGGILAYEIAFQLQTAGREVSLLIMLDSPNPSSLESCFSLTQKLNYLSYCLKRAARLGLRTSLVYVREHLLKRFSHTLITKSDRTEMRAARETLEAAVFAYKPENYKGKVLLLLASERPPHVNLLPGWQAVVSGNLHIHYLDGHRRDLAKAPTVRSTADAIVSHLISTTEEKSLSCCADARYLGSSLRMKAAEDRQVTSTRLTR